MQHYGFTRIYDRHNAAPKKLAARMDLVLSATWFVFIMLASGEWLAGILEDLFLTAELPLAVVLPRGAIRAVTMRDARRRDAPRPSRTAFTSSGAGSRATS